MKVERNRHGRKDDRERAARRGRLRWACLTAALASLALAATPAQAITGGAGVFPSTGAAPNSGGLTFGSMRSGGATWYGPGLYGNSTACGQTLRPRTIGVAHRTLPCGTAVKFVYRGRALVTRVIDRGPYTRGNVFDLTNGARRLLRFEGVDRVRYAVARRPARRDRS